MDARPSIGPGMTGHRQLAALLAGVLLASPAAAREKVVRMTLGPFRIEANRDREVCQAVRVPSVPGMEITSWEVRSRTSRGGKVGSHHMVVYGYRGADAAAFPHARSRRDVVDIPGCNGFGPAGRAELGQDVRDVDAHGLSRDEQLVADLPVAAALGNEREHFLLATGQWLVTTRRRSARTSTRRATPYRA